MTLLPLLSVKVPVLAALVVIALLNNWFAPTLIKPSPAKIVLAATIPELTLPLKLTVPVPLRLNVVVKTLPLKLTVVAFAPAVISKKSN
jgi:hypothetical protein